MTSGRGLDVCKYALGVSVASVSDASSRLCRKYGVVYNSVEHIIQILSCYHLGAAEENPDQLQTPGPSVRASSAKAT